MDGVVYTFILLRMRMKYMATWENKKKRIECPMPILPAPGRLSMHFMLFRFPIDTFDRANNLKYICLLIRLRQSKACCSIISFLNRTYHNFCLLKFNELLRKLKTYAYVIFCVSQPKRKEKWRTSIHSKIITNYQCRKCSRNALRWGFNFNGEHWICANNIFVDKLTTHRLHGDDSCSWSNIYIKLNV